MLIDDDDDDNFFHQIVINEMNVTEHIEIALNGEEALLFLKKENRIHPDIIFLDINMPKMNGWEFMDSYKELRADQNPEDKKRAALYSEITGFNSKPLTKEMLVAILEKHF
jgi:CheY-like chemotaxis protein